MNGKPQEAVAPRRVARAFGVRGLDPALTFGGTSAGGRKTVRRIAAYIQPACQDRSWLNALSDERKSWVKPQHSKASRHSRGASFYPNTLPYKAL